MIISFLPTFEADVNLFQFHPLDDALVNLILKAKAIIVPPTVSPELYFFIKKAKIPVFPEYTLRFLYPGKIGQILLFKNLNLPHPKTTIIQRLCGIEENPFQKKFSFPEFPFVIKGNWGNEGTEVFLIENSKDLENVLKKIKIWEIQGRFGFLIQEYIPSKFDARAVVIGDEILIFFREGGFKKNIVQEGKIVEPPSQDLFNKVFSLTKNFVKLTGFNLVAIDFLIKDREVLLNELNFVFGRRAIKEETYEKLLKKAINSFLAKVS